MPFGRIGGLLEVLVSEGLHPIHDTVLQVVFLSLGFRLGNDSDHVAALLELHAVDTLIRDCCYRLHVAGVGANPAARRCTALNFGHEVGQFGRGGGLGRGLLRDVWGEAKFPG